MIYLVIAVFVLHLISAPIVIGCTVFADSDRNVGKIKIAVFGIPIFTKRIDINRILDRVFNDDGAEHADSDGASSDKNSGSNKGNGQKFGNAKRFLIGCARRIALRVRVRNAELECVLGTGDAAATATAVGAFSILCSQICAFFDIDGEKISIVPEYRSERIYLDFFGIFSLCFADIIIAVCATAVMRLRRGKTERSKKYANVVTE